MPNANNRGTTYRGLPQSREPSVDMPNLLSPLWGGPRDPHDPLGVFESTALSLLELLASLGEVQLTFVALEFRLKLHRLW